MSWIKKDFDVYRWIIFHSDREWWKRIKRRMSYFRRKISRNWIGLKWRRLRILHSDSIELVAACWQLSSVWMKSSSRFWKSVTLTATSTSSVSRTRHESRLTSTVCSCTLNARTSPPNFAASTCARSNISITNLTPTPSNRYSKIILLYHSVWIPACIFKKGNLI